MNLDKLKFVLVTFGMLAASASFAQCEDQLLAKAANMIGDYTYTKDFRVKLKKAKKNESLPFVKQAVILNKGVKYRIFLCNADEYPGQLVFELYNNEKKILSSYDVDRQKHFKIIEFDCKQTGAYTAIMYFQEGQEGCAISVIAFEGDEAKSSR
jgi:hypothetical protein